ncbi:MAG TPA: extracellular solute-binding protein [Candidatus Hydrogenedentes bacterium]|nr:extracellular solute-binding protein [Candidatus Hydrogenedentota bacterium]
MTSWFRRTRNPMAALTVAALFFWMTPVASGETEETADGKIELHVWGLNMGSFVKFGSLALVDAFEKKYPNVKVIIGPSDRGQDLQKLLCGVIGNVPPDVFKREVNLFGDISARGILRPLDDFIEQDQSRPDGLHREDYNAGIWESGRAPDGKIYGIVEATNSLFLAYNKAIFREVGLDPENPPRTWDEWIDASAKLVKKDEGGNVTRWASCVVAPYKEDDLVFYIAQTGAKILSEDGRTCLLDSPEALQAMTFLQKMYEVQGGRRQYDRFAQMQETFGSSVSPFGAGRVVMGVEGDTVISEAMRTAPDMELGIAPVPMPRADLPPITTSAKHALYLIPYNAKHSKEAWDFIRFANSPEGMLAFMDGSAKGKAEIYKKFVEEYCGFRANKKTFDALAAKYAPTRPNLKAAFDTCKNLMDTLRFEPVPNSPIYAIIRDECQSAVDHVLYNGQDPKVALANADRRVQEQLDIYYARMDSPPFRWMPVWIITGVLCLGALGYVLHKSREERAATALQRHENRMGPIFISPWLIGFVVFTAGPMVFSLAMSFCDYDVIHKARWVGLQNYNFLMFHDPLFIKSLNNTLYMVGFIFVHMAIALGIALLLNTKVKGMPIYRTVFYLPAITPAVAASVLWYALLNPDGLINDGLRWLGMANPPLWLGSPVWSKPAIVLMGIWSAGGGMIMWLAGLQGIPTHLYEAASIDGASKWRQFWSVTLPMLTPYMFFSFVTGIIGVFQIFAQALILTKGGPADSTMFYVYYLFNNAFRYFKMGYASAMAWILFAIVLALTLLQTKLAKKWVHYE